MSLLASSRKSCPGPLKTATARPLDARAAHKPGRAYARHLMRRYQAAQAACTWHSTYSPRTLTCARGSEGAREERAAFPCASTYYNGSQRIEKRLAAGRARPPYVAGLEHTGHHLWHDGVFKQPGPWRNAYDAYDVGDRARTCADDANLGKGPPRGPGAYAGDVLLHLPSCSYPVRDTAMLRGTRTCPGWPPRPRPRASIFASFWRRGGADIVRDPYNGFTAERISILARSCQKVQAQLPSSSTRDSRSARRTRRRYVNATRLSQIPGRRLASRDRREFPPEQTT